VDEPDHTRLNDCRCDPAGRLWAGTMSRERRPGTAALYRLGPGGLERAIGGTTISNGLGWSPDGRSMYFIDSPTQRIDVLDYDVATGRAADRRPLVTIPEEDGLPDGLTVDAEGGIWVALFGGGAVRRYAPDGGLDAHVALPASHPTCPAFGGDDLRTLFVTTSRHRLTPAERAAQPLAGAVLGLRPGPAGRPGTPFAGPVLM
jgi:sugar lactone lactonase YvrE